MHSESYLERQRAICLTALAYNLKQPYTQYDSAHLTYLHQDDGGNKRQNSYVTPEDATPDHTIYTVCSSFGFEVYWEALRYELMGKFVDNGTHNYFNDAPEEIVVFKWDSTKDAMTRQEALEKLRSLMEPGDAVVGVKEKSGHIMLYCGDVDQDGIPDLIHSTSSGGGKYNIDTGIDKVEAGGDIRKQDAFSFLFEDLSHLGKGHCYWLGKEDKIGFILLRPLLGEAGNLPLTPAARGRLKFPMLAIDRTVSTKEYGAVQEGGLLTYQILLRNFDKTDYHNVPITETIPEGTELETAEQAVVAGRTILWDVDVPAGGEVIRRYTVRVTAKTGEEIKAFNGNVAGIPSNRLVTRVCRQHKDLSVLADRTLWDGKFAAGNDFVIQAYRRALGMEIKLPTVSELIGKLFYKDEKEEVPVYRLTDDAAWHLVIRRYFGGRCVVCFSSNDRILEHRMSDLFAGDVIYSVKKDGTEEVWLYTGKELLACRDGVLVELTEADLVALHTNEFFVGVRPVQM